MHHGCVAAGGDICGWWLPCVDGTSQRSGLVGCVIAGGMGWMGGWYGLWYSGWYGGHVIHGVHSSREAGREGLPTNSKTVLATKSFFLLTLFFLTYFSVIRAGGPPSGLSSRLGPPTPMTRSTRQCTPASSAVSTLSETRGTMVRVGGCKGGREREESFVCHLALSGTRGSMETTSSMLNAEPLSRRHRALHLVHVPK